MRVGDKSRRQVGADALPTDLCRDADWRAKSTAEDVAKSDTEHV